MHTIKTVLFGFIGVRRKSDHESAPLNPVHVILAGIALVVLFGLLGGALWAMIAVWTHIDAKMSAHGWIALVLGVVLSLAVGIGLMGLMFFSSRRGYDEPPTFD